MNLNFLIRMHATNQSTSDAQELLNMLRHTMDKMAAGGINDHVCKVRKPEVHDAFQAQFWRRYVRYFLRVSIVTRPTPTGMFLILKRCCTTKPNWATRTPSSTKFVHKQLSFMLFLVVLSLNHNVLLFPAYTRCKIRNYLSRHSRICRPWPFSSSKI